MKNTNKLNQSRKLFIAVMGVGYVGKPLIDQLSKKNKVIAFDINKEKIEKLNKENKNKNIIFSSNESILKNANTIIVCVPTPVNSNNLPKLEYIELACKTIGKNIKKDTLVIFESSYMPTYTEEYCIPLIEKYSNLKNNVDFFVGYSPERINPGDKKNTLNTITKLIGAQEEKTLDMMEEVYSQIKGITLHKTPNIKVAELSKLLENCQRDINIAFMNEVTKLCHKLDININDVIESASTKWNFMKYYPGLVGGDCVGVNSYYLMDLAQKYDEQLTVLETAREINVNMTDFIVEQLNDLIKKFNKKENDKIKITIYGYTYKEDISDIRNTKVKDLYHKLVTNNYSVTVCDYNISLNEKYFHQEDINNNDVIILAVPHKKYAKWSKKEFEKKFSKNSKYKIFMDLKAKYDKNKIPKEITYWNL